MMNHDNIIMQEKYWVASSFWDGFSTETVKHQTLTSQQLGPVIKDHPTWKWEPSVNQPGIQQDFRSMDRFKQVYMMHLASTLIGKALGYAQQQYRMQVVVAFDRPRLESAMMDPIHSGVMSPSRTWRVRSLSLRRLQNKWNVRSDILQKYARHCNTILALKATFADISRACYFHTAFALLSHSWFWLSLQVPYNNLSQNLCIPSRSFVTFLRPFCCCSPASNGFPKPQDSQDFQCNNLCQHSARYREMSS